MTIVFFCNYLNHHQVHVADELYALLNNQSSDQFYFVATLPPDPDSMKGGADYTQRPYCIVATASPEASSQAMHLAQEADVCLFGACSQQYATARAKTGKLSFEIAERWLKRGWINILSPHLLRWRLNYHRHYRKAPFYILCASAYAAADLRALHAYEGRCFRWGYFTKALSHTPQHDSGNSIPQIMWCSRFISWKHPELMIKAAKLLKDSQYSFHLTMYGDGPEKAKTEMLAKEYDLCDVVSFPGTIPNEQVQQQMRESDIFVLSSDKNEGWGVVINESMGNGCCTVSSNEAGAVPFIIEHGKNGMAFESKSFVDLYENLRYLLDHPTERNAMSTNAMEYIHDTWNAHKAALSLLELIDCITNNHDISKIQGICCAL